MSYREYLGKLGTKGPTGVEGGFERRVSLSHLKSPLMLYLGQR